MNLHKIILLVLGGILCFASARLVIDENTPARVFDKDLYNSVIDRDECRRQVDYLKTTNPILLAQCKLCRFRFSILNVFGV